MMSSRLVRFVFMIVEYVVGKSSTAPCIDVFSFSKSNLVQTHFNCHLYKRIQGSR